MPRRRPSRLWLWLLGLPVLLGLGGYAALNWLIDEEALRPQIEAAASEALGREVRIGAVSVGLSFVPELALDAVEVAGPPGGPPLLRVQRIEAEIAVLPLLSRRVDIRRLSLERPEIVLPESADPRLAAPRRASPPPAASPAPAPAAPAAGERRGVTIALRRFEILDGHLSHGAERVELPRFSLAREGALTVSGELRLRGLAFRLEGSGGSAAELAAGTPFAYRLRLRSEGLDLLAEGEIAPRAASGRVALHAVADRATRLAPLAPGLPWPELTGLDLRAEALLEPGAVRPVAFRLATEGGPLAPLLAGARLGRSELSVSRDEPARLAAEGAFGAVAWRAEGEGPTLAELLEGGAQPFALRLAGPGATLEARGEAGLEGGSARLTARARDLAALWPAAPSLTEADLSTELAWGSTRLAWRELRLLAMEAEVASEGELGLEGRPALRARLAAKRLDLDRMAARPAPAAPRAGSPAPPPAPAPAARAPAGPARVIPDLPLDLAPLARLDADLDVTVDELRAAGIGFRAVALRARLAEGRLAAEPLAFSLPGGRLAGRLAAEASPQRVALALRHDGAPLDLGQLLPALGVVGRYAGRLEIEADLAGEGAGLRALAASAGGSLAFAVTQGVLDSRLTEDVVAGLRQFGPVNVPPGGTQIACLAGRAEVERGVARLSPALVDSSLGRIGANGTVDLGSERLSLALRTDLRIGPLRVRAPVPLTGTLAEPRFDWSGAAGGVLAGEIGRLIPGALGNAVAAAGDVPDCPTVLAAVRGRPRAAPAPPPPQRLLPGGAGEALRGLLGR